jgi:hypothetical protein
MFFIIIIFLGLNSYKKESFKSLKPKSNYNLSNNFIFYKLLSKF